MKHFFTTALVLLAVAATAVSAALDEELPNPLTLTVSPQVANAPAQVVVRVRVEPDQRNRELTIEWWSEEGIGGLHSRSLEGEEAPSLYRYAIKRMEQGEYVVTARVTRDDGSDLTRDTTVIVAGEGEPFTSFDELRPLSAACNISLPPRVRRFEAARFDVSRRSGHRTGAWRHREVQCTPQTQFNLM